MTLQLKSVIWRQRKMTKISKNFTLEEFIKSTTAKNKKIDNTPSDTEIFYINKLAEQLQRIRDRYGKPIIISSGYRCDKLNRAVGGAKNSDHRFGAASDIHSLEDTYEANKELWDVIMSMYTEGELALRQIIDEYKLDWIHISVNNEFNKMKNNEILHIV